jgi:hypothetical protein
MHTLRHEKGGTAMIRQTTHQIDGNLTIRRLGADDAGALERLAQRDSAAVPKGTVYVAVAADGSLLAAISLESRTLVADPFAPTAHAASLLRTWALELGAAPRPRWIRGGLANGTSAPAATTAPVAARAPTAC